MVDAVVAGGATRSASVRAGLAAVPDDATIVLVHDAARPLASMQLWELVIAGAGAGHDAVVPAVPVVDTLREVGGATVDRTRFVAVQTPQGFRADVLRRAHASGADGTDDASLVEAIGGKVLVVDGEPENRKITTLADLTALQGFHR
jgi:2-C-methyl-D-erythritol 4-phosphate cytidylyltransferase